MDTINNTATNTQSKATIMGCACVIFSSLTPDEIKRYKSYHPEALRMIDEDSGEPVFSIDLDSKKPGSLTEDGAVFSTVTSADGKATITILIDPECEDRVSLVEAQIGGALLKLSELENQLVEKLPTLEEEQKTVIRSISII